MHYVALLRYAFGEMTTFEKLLGVNEARAILGGISQTTMWRLTKTGAIGHVRVGGRVFFEESEVAAYLGRQRHPATAPMNDDGREPTRPSVPTATDGAEAVDLAAV